MTGEVQVQASRPLDCKFCGHSRIISLLQLTRMHVAFSCECECMWVGVRVGVGGGNSSDEINYRLIGYRTLILITSPCSGSVYASLVSYTGIVLAPIQTN